MRSPRLLFLVLLPLVATACKPTPPPPPKLSTPEIGLQVFPTARAFDPPGQLLIIESGGDWRRVADLSPRLPPPKLFDEEYPVWFQDSDMSANLLFSFLGVGSLAGSTKWRLSVKMEITGAKREIQQEVDLSKALAETPLNFHDHSHYVIAETVWADSVKIRVERTQADSVGADAKVKEILTAGGYRLQSDSTAWVLDKRFGQRLRIFYKARRVEALFSPSQQGLGGKLGDTVQTILPVEHEGEPLFDWQTQREIGGQPD